MAKRIEVNRRCTGCNMCISVCPKQAILLKIDEYGFWYPEIDEESCINCGLCNKICPVYGKNINSRFGEPITYAGWNRNEEVRERSSSGGLFTAIAEGVLMCGGVIYGAAFTELFSVEHRRITSLEELNKLQGSKYVQSLIKPELYITLENDLKSGKQVLFSGTPCQTAAINNWFGDYENLLTVDVICHGVPSPYVWQKYLEELSQQGMLKKINMRDKTTGWNKYHMVITYENGEQDDKWFNDNPWGKSFVSSLFLRESCYSCEFKEYVRTSDISLGDFWEAARGIHRELDDNDKGTSVILVNSPKGKEIIEKLTDCNIVNIPYEWIPDRTYAVVRSSARNVFREKAFNKLNKKKNFTWVVKKYTKASLKHRVVGKIIKLKRNIVRHNL